MIIVSISMPSQGNRDAASLEQLGPCRHCQGLYQSQEQAAQKENRAEHPLWVRLRVQVQFTTN